ncbi:hypothetical protein PGB90_004593 [Kerria lacca]
MISKGKTKKSIKRKTCDSGDTSSAKKKNDLISSRDNGSKNENGKKEKIKNQELSDSKEKEVVHKSLPLLEKYWKAVKDDPTDFTGWTYLLQYVDQASDIAAASEVYDDFLSRYPYCYGYWRKYADYLKKNGEKIKCEEIFEKGVSAIPLSVDLWIHYLNYIKDAYVTDETLVRNLFERSLKSCGLEFRSDRLWDSYVKWEIEGGRLQNVTKLFDRWLAVPTQGYVTVMEKFKEHVKKNSPNKILDPEEFFCLRNEVLNETKASNSEMESKLSDDAPPGEEAPDKLDKMNEEETKALKEKIISTRKEIHKITQKEALARWSYEENIKRPYFHVKPLEQCQLNNWKEYLDFEIKEGNQERIILLFERCLIACALYEEFWIKFVEYLQLQPVVLVEKVREVFIRACTIHHTKKLNVHLKWAAFEETYANPVKAAEIIEEVEKLCPNILVSMLRHINIFRRRSDYDKVCSLYEHYIKETSEKKEISSSLSIKYARFSCKILNDTEKGINILKTAIDNDKSNSRLRLQLIDVYMNKIPVDVPEILNIMDDVIEKEEDSEKKLLFAQRKLEFLEEFSDDCVGIQKAQEAYDAHLKIVAEKKKMIEEKKAELNTKKNGAVDQTNQVATVAYSTTNPQSYYQAGPPPTYQTYPQGYMPSPYQQQNMYPQSDPNYGYQNWQSYGAYNQTWPTGSNPQAGATGGYNYMY